MLGKIAFLTVCVFLVSWFVLTIILPGYALIQRGFMRVGHQIESVAR